MKARRYNKGKIRYELISSIALKDLAEVYTLGAHKYSDYRDEQGNIIQGKDIQFKDIQKYELIYDACDNWRLGLDWMGLMASVERHIQDWKKE